VLVYSYAREEARNMKHFCSMLTLLFVTAASADNQDDLTIKSIDDVIIIESNEDTTTLGDLMSAMGIKQEDFVTEYKLPTKHERESLRMESYPIVIWENPQEIKNPNPPANRSGVK